MIAASSCARNNYGAKGPVTSSSKHPLNCELDHTAAQSVTN